MRTLFIAPYRDGSGWSKAALDFIRAFQQAKLDLVIRPIKYNLHNENLPKDILELENKDIRGCDNIVYFTLPDHIIYNSKFKKNICYLLYETSDFNKSNWAQRLNLMDEVWVPSEFVKTVAINSQVKVPIKIVPIPVNLDKYLKNHNVYKQIDDDKHGDFLFYTICETNNRKNLSALIKAFHLEFDLNEPVNLVLKVSGQKSTPSQMYDYCNYVKKELRIARSKKEIILTNSYLSDNDIDSIHMSCDNFVSTSYGEGWCIPAIDALGFGKTPIVTGWSSFTEYLTNKEGWLVNYDLVPVQGMENHPCSLYYGNELWASISIPHLRKCMREAYSQPQLKESKLSASLSKIFEFSYEQVGEKIKKAIS